MDGQHVKEGSPAGKHFEALSKNLSTARRFFKLFRFLKHFEGLKEAREEKSRPQAKGIPNA